MRKKAGRETWNTLLEWDTGHTAAERMVAQLLIVEGFKSVDPSHPLGGPDGLKDVACLRDDRKFVAAAYFPRGQLDFSATKDKFANDYKGVATNNATGFVFVTNQELRLSERESLLSMCSSDITIELYHLERITAILNSPVCYGIRLEYLDVEMTKEEQVSFIAERDTSLKSFFDEQKQRLAQLNEMIARLEAGGSGDVTVLRQLKEFKQILDEITSESPFRYTVFSSGHVSALRVPLNEIREFQEILERLTRKTYGFSMGGNVEDLKVPLSEIREYEVILGRIMKALGRSSYGGTLALLSGPGVGSAEALHVPTQEIKEYEATLDRIILKLRQKRALEGN